MSTEVPTTPGQPLPDWERDLIALDAQRQEQFNAWIDKQGYVDPLGQLAEAFEGGWADAAAHAASSGYRGAAQHTYTDACDGFHEPGQDCNLPAAPESAKVVIVRDASGQSQRYAATGWDAEDAIDVTLDGDVIATYPPGYWTRVHRDGALAPEDNSTAIALGIAKRALEAVTRISNPNVAIKLAMDALEEIFAETD